MSFKEENILRREMPLIQKIIQDETWLEGERRGCYVSSDDPAVRERVCAIILRVGQQLRDAVTRELGGSIPATDSVPATARGEQRAAA